VRRGGGDNLEVSEHAIEMLDRCEGGDADARGHAQGANPLAACHSLHLRFPLFGNIHMQSDPQRHSMHHTDSPVESKPNSLIRNLCCSSRTEVIITIIFNQL
jgi:hypothetical protein